MFLFFFNSALSRAKHIPCCIRPEKITSVISLRWEEMRETTVSCHIEKQQEWGYNMFPQMRKSLISQRVLRSFHQKRWQIRSKTKTMSHCGVQDVTHYCVGHTFLSLPWWISLPRLHADLSKSCLWVSPSQHHKVPFVSATFGSSHTCPHGDT